MDGERRGGRSSGLVPIVGSGVSSAIAKEKLRETKVEGWVEFLYVYIVL